VGPYVPVHSPGALPGPAAVGQAQSQQHLDSGSRHGLRTTGHPCLSALRPPGPHS
jgi:hypothetical protein